MMMAQQQQQYAQAYAQQQMPGQQMTGQSFQGPDPYAQQPAYNPYNPAAPAQSVSSGAVNTQAPVAGTRVGEASTPQLNEKTIAIGGARRRALAA
jgi:hypothetical protein